MTEGTSPVDIDAAYTRWADRYDSDRNLTRDLDRSVTADVLGTPLRHDH